MQGAVRTEGDVESVGVNGSTAYLPSGDYGVHGAWRVSPTSDFC